MEKQLNQLGEAIAAAGTDARYDAEARNLLANKPFLAWILKYTTSEFKNLTPAEIVPYIDNDPKVGTVSVLPGETNRMVTGLQQESNIPKEGKLYYDIRFFAKIPNTDTAEEFSLIIDVEMQNDPHPGYDLISRGILYCGRMLSEQMGRNVSREEGTNKYQYQHLQKVYSIWILANCSRKAANTISKYSVAHEAIYGSYEDHARSDLMNVVAIRLPKEGEEEKSSNKPTELHSILSTIFSQKLTVNERLDRLENNYGIEVTEKIRKEVTDMCNLSQGIRENAARQAEFEKARNIAINLIRESQMTDAAIAKACGLTEAEVKKLREDALTMA